MITGLAYVAASIGISILLMLANREAHESGDNIDYFRYPKVIQIVVLVGVFIWLAIGVAAPFLAKPGIDGPLAVKIISAIFMCASIGNLIAYIYLRGFYFAVSREMIKWRRFSKVRVLSYSDISMISHRRLDKGREDLSIHSRGKVILVLASTLQDFEILKNLVIGNAKLHGVKIVL